MSHAAWNRARASRDDEVRTRVAVDQLAPTSSARSTTRLLSQELTTQCTAAPFSRNVRSTSKDILSSPKTDTMLPIIAMTRGCPSAARRRAHHGLHHAVRAATNSFRCSLEGERRYRLTAQVARDRAASRRLSHAGQCAHKAVNSAGLVNNS
jgi:hypothetical protein